MNVPSLIEPVMSTVGERFVGMREDLIGSGKGSSGCHQNVLYTHMKNVNESINLYIYMGQGEAEMISSVGLSVLRKTCPS